MLSSTRPRATPWRGPAMWTWRDANPAADQRRTHQDPGKMRARCRNQGEPHRADQQADRTGDDRVALAAAVENPRRARRQATSQSTSGRWRARRRTGLSRAIRSAPGADRLRPKCKPW